MSINTIIFDKKNQIGGIALLDDSGLREIEIVNEAQALTGNIYLGKITKKVSLAHDKEGFFVNIGLDQDGFLNADEYGLNDLKLNEGQSIVVQVAQEQRAEKNAKLVRAIQLVGNYLVYCPYRMNVEASSKIEDKALAAEYVDQLKENTTGQEGWILRTSAADVAIEAVLQEMNELRSIYENVRVKARNAHSPSLLFAKPDSVFEYIARFSMSLHKIVTNNHHFVDAVKEKYTDKFEIEFAADPFEKYGIDEAVEQALEKYINLKGGGRVTIEETRACVAIDVDTGKDSGGGAINRINEVAAFEIAKHIRLRNLAGKIVIDFAGHSDYKFIKPLLSILEEELAEDTSKSHICGLSRSGLVEIIRVRKRPSLSELMMEECRTCQGTGRVEKGA